jgi:hypothetical protein
MFALVAFYHNAVPQAPKFFDSLEVLTPSSKDVASPHILSDADIVRSRVLVSSFFRHVAVCTSQFTVGAVPPDGSYLHTSEESHVSNRPSRAKNSFSTKLKTCPPCRMNICGHVLRAIVDTSSVQSRPMIFKCNSRMSVCLHRT